MRNGIKTKENHSGNIDGSNEIINNIKKTTLEIFSIIDQKAGYIEVSGIYIKNEISDIYNRMINNTPISKKEQDYFYGVLQDEKAIKIIKKYLNDNGNNCEINNFISKLKDLIKNYHFVVDFDLKNLKKQDENIFKYNFIKEQKLLQGMIIIKEDNKMFFTKNYEKINYLGNGLFFVIEEETESELEEKVGEKKDENNEEIENEEKKLKYGKILLFNGKMMELYREKNIKSMEIIEDNGEKYILTTDYSLQKGLLKLENELGIIDLNKIIENENFKIILKNGVIFAVKNKKDNGVNLNNIIGLLRAYFYNKKEKSVKKECLGDIYKDTDLIFYGENKDILEVNTAGDNIRSFFKFDKNGIGLIKGLGNIKSSFPKYSWGLLSDFIDGKPVYIKYNSKEKQKNGIVLKNDGIIYFIDLKKYFSENLLGYKEIINRFKFINGKAYLLKDKYKIIEGEKNTEDFNIMKKLFNKGVNINAPWEKIKKYYKEIKIEEIGSFEEKDGNN